MQLVEVDGSYGEGGGQILRVASAFSVIFGRPIHVRNIRAGRDNPGLRPQHLASLQILESITSGKLEGGEVGSTEIYFYPSEVKQEKLEWDLRTAGSITLVLQTLIPAVSLSGKYLEVKLRGGTDVPWSPTCDYLEKVVKEAFGRIGINFEMKTITRGYYPKGGGKVEARIYPSRGIIPLTLKEEPLPKNVSIISRCGSLPKSVAERQARAAEHFLKESNIPISEVVVSLEESASPGTSLLVYCSNNTCIVGSDRIGERGVRAEKIGSDASERFVQILKSKSTTDPNLSDMLGPLLTISNDESEFYVSEITEHLRTSLYVASLFSNFKFSYNKEEDKRYLVRIFPSKEK
jgi:RNA 3'-phosphate cyclase